MILWIVILIAYLIHLVNQKKLTLIHTLKSYIIMNLEKILKELKLSIENTIFTRKQNL